MVKLFDWPLLRALTSIHRELREIRLDLVHQHGILIRIERKIMTLRDEFNENLSELGASITELSTRVDELPDSVDDLEQADLDAIKSFTSRVRAIAVQSPEVPTPDLPDAPVEDGTGETGDQV